MTVVDPYRRGRLGFSGALVTARRAARRQRRVKTRWIRLTSLDAARVWREQIDLVMLDGIHTLEGVCLDWAAFGGFVCEGGRLIARNDVVGSAADSPEERSSMLLDSVDPERWRVVCFGETLTAFERLAN